MDLSELKTLKDFEEHICNIDECCRGDLYYNLKQEAIKWIKEMIDTKNKEFCKISLSHFPDLSMIRSIENTIEWIKHFFNITEEDLQ